MSDIQIDFADSLEHAYRMLQELEAAIAKDAHETRLKMRDVEDHRSSLDLKAHRQNVLWAQHVCRVGVMREELIVLRERLAEINWLTIKPVIMDVASP